MERRDALFIPRYVFSSRILPFNLSFIKFFNPAFEKTCLKIKRPKHYTKMKINISTHIPASHRQKQKKARFRSSSRPPAPPSPANTSAGRQHEEETPARVRQQPEQRVEGGEEAEAVVDTGFAERLSRTHAKSRQKERACVYRPFL
jgi:hypothetical protein